MTPVEWRKGRRADVGIHWVANRRESPGWVVDVFTDDGDCYTTSTHRWRWQARVRAWAETRRPR